MDRKELKIKAKEAIKGKIWILFALILLVGVVTGFISGITFGYGSILTILIAGGVALSFASIYLAIVDKNKKPAVEDILYGFKDGNFGRGFIAYIRITVFTFLWMLLFYIPGIVKALAYSQTYYILADDKKIDPGEAQKKSIALMDGHKGELFVLYLSFIPWLLLVTVTFGIAIIYVGPYINATLANFYRGLLKTKKA